MVKKIYEKLAKAIVHQTYVVIGPVAITQANRIKGLKTNHQTIIQREPVKVIRDLINRYVEIMGRVAITIAKKGAAPILKEHPNLKVPEELTKEQIIGVTACDLMKKGLIKRGR